MPRKILSYGGVAAVVKFAEAVKQPESVGNALGVVAEVEADERILPTLLETENDRVNQFMGGYVWSRHEAVGMG